MTDYTVWATITVIGPREFVVVATAVPAIEMDSRTHVITQNYQSLQQAQKARELLVVQLSELVREQGHRIVDVEIG